ncbi:cytochrome c family protein [Bradyrhizobium sp. Rc2d]|uniref:c-type cytochrome n=1 Tax=Bradyrhizobium sp. Rc2d TaxID=1855321 RepID=UPI001FCE0340|nr:cytochrome c family protein [Bradyrhizobium sp. Rc2d]
MRGRATSDPDPKRMFPMKGAGKIGAFIAALVFAGATANSGYAQDAEHGKTIFNACATCHATDQADRVGPGLQGIIGRKAGAVPGFRYSNAMKKSDIVWDAKILDAYLESPQKVVPGNRMPYAGLKNPTDRADLVAYLATLK